MKIFATFIAFFSLCCIILMGNTVYSAYHVVDDNQSRIKDTLIIRHVQVRDTILFREERSIPTKCVKRKKVMPLSCCRCIAKDSV